VIRVHLPRYLAADYGADPVQAVAPAHLTVAGVLAALGERLPGVTGRILDVDGGVRPHLHIFVGGREIRSAGGTAAAVADGSELWVIRAVSGGEAVP
jgi:molybdopterin synthase sulfur carrier subunit